MTTKLRRNAETLVAKARDFSHPMVPKSARATLFGAALTMMELVVKVEKLEQELEQCREQLTTEKP